MSENLDLQIVDNQFLNGLIPSFRHHIQHRQRSDYPKHNIHGLNRLMSDVILKFYYEFPLSLQSSNFLLSFYSFLPFGFAGDFLELPLIW